jgi:DNA-binding MarR family transcriptional regulator
MHIHQFIVPRTRRVSTTGLCEQVLASCACGNVRRASRAVARFYEAVMEGTKLSATQFSLLTAIHLRGAVPLSRLADALVLDRTSLYRALGPLERAGDLRTAPGRNRREKVAALTDRGRRRLAEALPLWESAQRRFLGALGEDDWPAILAGFRKAVVAARQAAVDGEMAERAGGNARPHSERRAR